VARDIRLLLAELAGALMAALAVAGPTLVLTGLPPSPSSEAAPVGSSAGGPEPG
jgi:hypothetical protein